MCGIAGLVSNSYREMGPLLEEMLTSMKHRGPDGAGYVIGNECARKPTLDGLDFDGKKGNVALGHIRLAITGEETGLQPFQSEDGKISLLHNGEIYNFREIATTLNNNRSLSTGSDSEVLMKLIEQEYQGDLNDTMHRVLPKLDGVYALAVSDQEKTILARDRIGVRQLYYSIDRDLVAFSSERKPLWALMGNSAKTHRLLPGHMMVLDYDSFETNVFWTPDEILPHSKITVSSKAIELYDKAIRNSIAKRVRGRKHVGVIYSGGVDSVLVAYLTQQMGVPFTCYTAGRGKSAPDLEWALTTAKEFDFPIEVVELSLQDIEKLIPDVIRDIEDSSLNQVEVAIPIYASVRMAQEAGERVILTGQGADELFGGYPWYSSIVEREGYDVFEQRSWEDACLLYKECLEREDKIAMAHSIELRVPFLDPEVFGVAFAIAPELKIMQPKDRLRKYIHRKYCRSLGIPEKIANRVKEAAQHGANVHDAFEELADAAGITQELMAEVGYDPEKTVTEKLGSSSRYGYRYGDRNLWKPLPQVQCYLDMIAYHLNLLTPAARAHIEGVRSKLASQPVSLTKGAQL